MYNQRKWNRSLERRTLCLPILEELARCVFIRLAGNSTDPSENQFLAAHKARERSPELPTPPQPGPRCAPISAAVPPPERRCHLALPPPPPVWPRVLRPPPVPPSWESSSTTSVRALSPSPFAFEVDFGGGDLSAVSLLQRRSSYPGSPPSSTTAGSCASSAPTTARCGIPSPLLARSLARLILFQCPDEELNCAVSSR